MTKRLNVLRLLGAAFFGVAIYLSGASLIDPVSGDAYAQSSVRPPPNAANVAPAKPGVQVPEGQDTQGFGSPKLPTTSEPQPSQSAIWRRIRDGVQGTVSIPDKRAGVMVQSGGEKWRNLRNGFTQSFGGWILLIAVVLLALFFAVRGRIKVEHGMSGRTVERFNFIERFTHWLTALSFIVLGLTGLNILYGRGLLLPIMGKEAFAGLTAYGKLAHNYLAFAFMLGVIMMIVFWIRHNLPDRYDLNWLAKGGGMFSKGVHPPARKFNTGQKFVFWAVVILGISISWSGLALMFPFDIQPMAGTFKMLNIFGFGLPTDLKAIEEMQYLQLWHAIVGLIFVAVILAHIYIGTIGMEGAFDAMGTGYVDENWAKEHHSVWYEEEVKGGGAKKSTA